MAISEKMEHTTAKSKYVGQCATQNSKAEESGQQGLQRQNKHAFVALNKEKLTESGRYLKRCFDNGDDVIALVAPMDTSNKTDVVRAETQMILYLQSFMTKTSKLENGNLSNESQAKQAIDYERTAQLLWQIVEKGSIYRLSKNPTDTNYAVRIDRKSLEFGEPPQPLPLSYQPDELIAWLLAEVFNFDFSCDESSGKIASIEIDMHQNRISIQLPEGCENILEFMKSQHLSAQLVNTTKPISNRIYALNVMKGKKTI